MKELLVDIRTLKAIVLRAQKEKMSDGDKAFIFLHKYIIMNRMLVKIWILKAISVKSQRK